MQRELRGVGLGFRVEVAADLLSSPGAADFVEVVAEGCFSSPSARREAVAIARIWPVVPHGVKLSLGSAEGIDPDRARRLGALARELRAPVITEHVAFVRGGGREIGHLTQVPFTREAVRVVAANVAAARRALPDVPLLLENAAWTFRWPDDELDEGAFYTEIVEKTGCDLLLDLGNLHANAVNGGIDPARALMSYPLDRVAMIHIAGGVLEDGFYYDTHAHAVPEGVFDLLARLLKRAGPIPVVLERDDHFPPFPALSAEIERARAILAGAPQRHLPGAADIESPKAPPDSTPRLAAPALAEVQARLASILTSPDEPSPEAAAPYGERAIARSRGVLSRKRVDDALPLLARLAPHREAVKGLAIDALAAAPRAPSLSGIADAVRIASAAAADPRLAADARVDLLMLRSRFVGPSKGGSLRPRVGPFVGRERLPGGRVVWAVKGFGGDAEVRVFETRG